MTLRIGNGYDIHRLVQGRPLILGGQRLTHPDGLGLDGHSDADVLVHAVMDALLGRCRSGISANTSPRMIPSGKGPTVWCCWSRWWPWSRSVAGR